MLNKILGLAPRGAMAGAVASLALVAMADGASALNHPNGLALDAAGNLYVADSGNLEQSQTGDISVYSIAVKKSKIVATLTGTITSNIQYPYSVAVSPFGTIYAGNLGTNRITVYGANLAQTGTISDPTITTYAVNMFADGGGDLWALDAGGKVHVYLDTLAPVSTLNVGGIATAITQWGSNVAIWGRNASGISTLTANMGETVHGGAAFNGNYNNGSLVPTGAAEDSLHNQYVTNGSTGTVTVISADFTHVLATFVAYGTAIAIDSVHQRIYTAVPSNSTIYVYSLKAPYALLGSF